MVVLDRRGIIGPVSFSDSDEWRALRGRHGPGDEEWTSAKARFTNGVVTTGVVLSHHPFGFFVDLGEGAIGLVEIPRVKEPGQAVDPRDFPQLARRSLPSCWVPWTCSVKST